MKVPLLDLKAQYAPIGEQVRAAVNAVLNEQRFILGPEVLALEDEIARYCEVPHAIAVASGTDALLLSLKALGVGAGDSVITAPYTFFATAGTVANLGARPLFIDIQESSFNLDPRRLADFLSHECSFNLTNRRVLHKQSNTSVKAIVPVHLYGQCADMSEIMDTARRFSLPVVEDACQAIGARYQGRRAGSMGSFGCFSFFPSKNLGGAGDGGMVTTCDESLARLIRLLRGHGAHPKYYHAIVGFNSRLDELQAAILRVKLPHLDDWSQRRRMNAEYYGRELASAGLKRNIRLPLIQPERDHIFHQYVIRCKHRDALQEFLRNRGVGTEVYYPVALHEQACFQYLGYAAADCPNAHRASKETLALPIYPELTEEQKSYVVHSIAEFYQDKT